MNREKLIEKLTIYTGCYDPIVNVLSDKELNHLVATASDADRIRTYESQEEYEWESYEGYLSVLERKYANMY